ncbi:MAG: magnesium/cobalt transporter CorA [Pseudomonadota bacterium]
MLKFAKKIAKKAGASPGTLVHVGERKTETARITVMDYDGDRFLEQELAAVEDAFHYKDRSTTTWLNIDGIHDIELIEKIGVHFGIHPLTLEDVLNTGQRPKAEEFEEYIYLVFKMLYLDEAEEEVRSEQISLILGQNILLSFQETKDDVFAPVRERIRKGKGRIRKSGGDYLAYALIDAVVDHYFVVLEKMGTRIESLEDELTGQPASDTLQAIHEVKRELIYLRKQVWPLRELIGKVIKGDFSLIGDPAVVFYQDVYDHAIQVMDTVESYRDVLSGIQDLYLSAISNRMNEVMKVLTIIATIFIPITFVAGIYGMNFKYMPELDWQYGYFAVWGIIGIVVVCMLLYFRSRKWI